MARVTTDEVASLLDTPPSTLSDLDVFIASASVIVDRLEKYIDDNGNTCMGDDSDTIDNNLKYIEMWLSAHYYSIKERRFKREQIRSTEREYSTKVDLGLKVTEYGQQAIAMDCTGFLKTMDNGPTKFMFSMMSTVDTQPGTDYQTTGGRINVT